MQQPYVVAIQLDGMTTINRAWYTREEQVYLVTFELSKDHIKIDDERDQNQEKITKYIDILSKYVMGEGTRIINALVVWSTNLDDIKF